MTDAELIRWLMTGGQVVVVGFDRPTEPGGRRRWVEGEGEQVLLGPSAPCRAWHADECLGCSWNRCWLRSNTEAGAQRGAFPTTSLRVESVVNEPAPDVRSS
jgi:hypothetical protein